MRVVRKRKLILILPFLDTLFTAFGAAGGVSFLLGCKKGKNILQYRRERGYNGTMKPRDRGEKDGFKR